jgi:hypothetical protein
LTDDIELGDTHKITHFGVSLALFGFLPANHIFAPAMTRGQMWQQLEPTQY